MTDTVGPSLHEIRIDHLEREKNAIMGQLNEYGKSGDTVVRGYMLNLISVEKELAELTAKKPIGAIEICAFTIIGILACGLIYMLGDMVMAAFGIKGFSCL